MQFEVLQSKYQERRIQEHAVRNDLPLEAYQKGIRNQKL